MVWCIGLFVRRRCIVVLRRGVVDGEKFRLMMGRWGVEVECWKRGKREGKRKGEATAEVGEAWYGG